MSGLLLKHENWNSVLTKSPWTWKAIIRPVFYTVKKCLSALYTEPCSNFLSHISQKNVVEIGSITLPIRFLLLVKLFC